MNTAGRTPPRAGVILDGRYQLDRAVGRGGMGMVFRATQLNLGRTVAVKVLPVDLVDRIDEFEARFRREALAISRLQHPNIVQVLDFGRDPHFGLYLVMEFLDGRSLDEVIFEDHPIPPRRVADLLIQALAGLQAAHAHSILHRDIKPANVMACNVPGRPDLVKVLDFGVARSLGSALDSFKLTLDGMVCGTPLYMAPEQAASGPLDARADVYAVGTVLYEMLTGHLPFDETAPMDYLAIKVAEDAPLARVMANGEPTPPGLLSIVMRSVAREPGERYPDAATFRESLEQWLGRTPRATPASPPGGGARAPAPWEGATGSPPPGGPLVEDGPTSPSNRWYRGPAAEDEPTEEDIGGPIPLDQLRGPPPPGTSSFSLASLPRTEPSSPAPAGADLAPAGPSRPSFGERLQGREELLGEIEGGFERAVERGWAGMLVYGPPGSGRSALLTRIGGQAAAAGWEVQPLTVYAEGTSGLLDVADLLPASAATGPRLLLVDGLDLLPAPLVQAVTHPQRFPERATFLLASARRPGGIDPSMLRRQLEPLPGHLREALVIEALGAGGGLRGPEVAYPGWLEQRLGLDLAEGRLVAEGEGWRYPAPPPSDERDARLLAADRIRGLQPGARELLVTLGLAPAGLPHAVLGGVPEAPEAADSAVGILLEEELVRWAGDRWIAASETVAAGARACCEDAPRLHARLASAFRQAASSARGGARRRLLLDEAEHRIEGGQPREAAAALADVARFHSAVAQPGRGVEPLRRALALSQGEVAWTTRRIRLAAQLAAAMVDAGLPREAMGVLKEVKLRERLDPRYPALVAVARARALDTLDHAGAGEALEKAARLASLARDGELQVEARLALAERALRQRDRVAAARHAEQASYTSRLEGLASETRLTLTCRIAETLARTGPKSLARKLYGEADEGARGADLPHLAARAGLGTASLLVERGERRRAAEVLDTHIDDDALPPTLRARAALNRGLLHTLKGASEDADALYRLAMGWAALDGWREGVMRAARALGGA